MKYGHILHYVASTPWALLDTKMDEILALLAFRAAGHQFTAEEIQARIGTPPPPGSASKRGATAVIPLRGVIAHRMGTLEESSGGMSAERFAGMVRAAVADESIGTILLDVDSPGGTIPGVPEAADAVFAARDSKRVVAVANATMASAAYWIASQAHEIVAIPSAIEPSIGSIGVFMVHMDLSKHLEQEGVKPTLIKAGKHKAGVNPFTPLTEEQQADLQASVDTAYAAFVKAVARGRGVSVADVKGGFGEGKALSAVDAKAAGLIDRIGTFEETVVRVTGGRVGMRAEASNIITAAFDADPEAARAATEELAAASTIDMAAVLDAERRRRLERF